MVINTTPFFWGTIILFIATVFFYIICVSLIYYWHETRATYVVVPLLYTFEFFIIGFFIISIGSIVLQYLPEILTLAGS